MDLSDDDLDLASMDEETEPVNLGISQEMSKYLYDKAGELVPEDAEEISLTRYQFLLKDSIALIIEEVLFENPLPFKLQQFQLLTLHCIGSLRNVILVSPTGRSFTQSYELLITTTWISNLNISYEECN